MKWQILTWIIMLETMPRNLSNLTKSRKYPHTVIVQSHEFFELKEKIGILFDEEDYVTQMLTFRTDKYSEYHDIGFACSFKTREDYHLCKLLIGPVA